MLVEIRRLNIQNKGYKRDIFLEKIYINTANIVSIVNYDGAESFLIREHSKLSKEKFCLVKLNEGNRTEEIIAFGTAEKLYSDFRNHTGKQILND